MKDIYEALRAGPKWNSTLLFIAYDDAGGYYDHVIPPSEGVPADDAPCHLVDKCGTDQAFDFRRLGLRSSAMLISPWVANASVFQEPKGPFNTSQFELTSTISTVKNLFNLTGFLTKRDAWAGSFHELLLDTPRSATPSHLPEAPQSASPWDPPPGTVRPPGAPVPQHCSSWHGGEEQPCRGPTAVNLKQKRLVRVLSAMMRAEPPPLEGMTFAEADRWIGERWRHWMQRGTEL
eukprot:SRR837773.25083.p1 GENE.SRR837773.25083~~SRR837773.25083.p1  ORF type:complete len:242 (-),score=52.74 SRR837773.25083:51-752(-)